MEQKSISQDKLALESGPGQAVWLFFELHFIYSQNKNSRYSISEACLGD